MGCGHDSPTCKYEVQSQVCPQEAPAVSDTLEVDNPRRLYKCSPHAKGNTKDPITKKIKKYPITS